MKKILAILACVFFLFGCSPFRKFYKDETGGRKLDIVKVSEPSYDVVSSSGSILISPGSNYVLIGQSNFYSPDADCNVEDGLVQGRRVGASKVIFFKKYSHQKTGVIEGREKVGEIQSNTNLSGSGYGSSYNMYSGYTNYNSQFSGSANTTTNVYRTTYTPYTIYIFECRAAYWAQIKFKYDTEPPEKYKLVRAYLNGKTLNANGTWRCQYRTYNFGEWAPKDFYIDLTTECPLDVNYDYTANKVYFLQ